MDRDGTAAHHTVGAALDLRMLGPLEVWRGEERLALGGRRQRAVLVCLLLHPGHDVSTDQIVDAVWGDRPPVSASTTLQAYVFHLREILEPWRAKGAAPTVIVTVTGGYRLESSAVTIDARRFDELVAAGRSSLAADPAAAAAALSQALALWRGDVLADLASMNSFVAPVAARLAEARVRATELCVEAELALGGPGVLDLLDDLVARYPLREHLAALRMLALYRAGRQAEALAAYRQLRETLDDELGIRPSAEIETMYLQILRHEPSLDRRIVAPSAGPALPPEFLPPVSPDGSAQPVELLGASPATGTRGGVLPGVGRRGWAAISAIMLATVAAVMGSSFLLRADVTSLPANSVGPVDAHGLRGDAAMLDSAPSALVGAADAIWAVAGGGDAVVRIDPHDRRVTQTVHGVGRNPQAAAALGDADPAGVGGLGRLDPQQQPTLTLIQMRPQRRVPAPRSLCHLHVHRHSTTVRASHHKT